jgi:Predicted phage phi-C31 gp36 major capsid-like protein
MAVEFVSSSAWPKARPSLVATERLHPPACLTRPGGIDGVNANEDSTGVLQVEDLFDLAYGVKAEYARNGAWMLNRATLPLIRQF